ncbi:hypothetical protein Zmor_002314 [Zophobas morio]|uniref:Uncharacterized protein n=1 Tax=Zophobas morio TaxID=2755281 RepID=A0AA38J690_9CUCU|nr:hypothetical protein Zmor_002314 [Zophobas morio]
MRRTAVVEDERWTTVQLRKNQEDVDMGRSSDGKKMRWNGLTDRKHHTRLSTLRTDCLSEPSKVRNGSMLPCSWWFRQSEQGKLRDMRTVGSDAHFGINKTFSKVREIFY